MGKPGRPPKLDDETQQKIVKALKETGTLEDAAALAGVGRTTVFNWRAKGQKQRRGRYRDFLNAVEEALVARRRAREKKLIKHGDEDWRAIAWLMERTEPKRYAPRVRVHVEEELTDAIARLTAEFADQPELLERALSALTGDDSGPGADEDPDAEVPGDDRARGEAVQPAPAKREAGVVPQT